MYYRALFRAALLAGALLAACGGSSPDGGPDGGPDGKATATPEGGTSAVSGRAIVLGDIADDPAKKIARFTPLAEYLAANLSEHGITEGRVKLAPDMETMARWLAASEVDLYFDSLYPAMIVGDPSGARPILRRWKDGVSEYYTVIFARADSGIDSLDDLRGEVLALDEAFSTSGFLLPLAYLAEQGVRAVPATGALAMNADEAVRYSFSGDDENTLRWVISGVAAAGAIDDEGYLKLPEETRAGLVSIAETMTVPRQVAMLRPGVDAALEDAIAGLLLALDESPEGLEVLEVFKTTQFDAFPDGPEAALASLRTLYKLALAN